VATAATAAVPQHTTTNSTAFPWSTGTYVYDGAGNIIGIGSNVYRYDGVNRLVEGTAHTPQHQNRQTYVYDAFGNLTTVNTSVERQGAAPDHSIRLIGIDPATNRLDQSQCGGSTVGNVKCISGNHDEAGNQVSSTAGMFFEYDALGMMTRLTAGLRNEQYVYDANNERVAILEGADSRISIRNVDGKVVREFAVRASQWEWTKDYVHRESALLAAVVPTPAGEDRRHFHADHLGTPRLITDDRGFKLALHTYWPFGEEAPGSERDAERMKFTGHERDFGSRPDQDLDYMHARFYASGAARFLSADPVLQVKQASQSPQGWNRYSYVRNNPINAIDPTGKYEVNCKNDASCKTARDAFEAQRLAALKSKNEDVRAAAAAWGKLGEKNNIWVKFAPQADLAQALGPGATGGVRPQLGKSGTAYQVAVVAIELTGRELQRTIVHEGSHVNDNARFLGTFKNGKFDASSNFTVMSTEFKAFKTGQVVMPYKAFSNDRELRDFITKAYPNPNELKFDPADWPQQ